MSDTRFTEEDRAKVVKYLNMVATHARFDHDTNELIEYFKLLSFMQKTLIPKIDSHVFEITKVVEPKTESPEPSPEDKGE